MKEFEERQRELFRAHLRVNVAEFTRTHDATMNILGARKLTRRSDAQHIAQSLMIARQPAWAAISVNLHNQLKQLVKETAAHLGTKFAIVLPTDLDGEIDKPVMQMTLPQWLSSAEIMEHQRVTRALKTGFLMNGSAMDAFISAAPYSPSNSAVSAITVTSATATINRVAMRMFPLAGHQQYRLETSGDIRSPDIYKKTFPVTEEPRSPSFIGDRSYPVPA